MKSLTIFFSIFFLAVNVLSGCTVALVGGYIIGEDDRKAERIVDDAVITAEVKALFLGLRGGKRRILHDWEPSLWLCYAHA